MENYDKLFEGMMKIKNIKGFYVTIPGDMSVGINDQEFTVTGDFYFDNEEELSEFKHELMLTFGSYCFENPLVETFDERQSDIENEMERM